MRVDLIVSEKYCEIKVACFTASRVHCHEDIALVVAQADILTIYEAAYLDNWVPNRWGH